MAGITDPAEAYFKNGQWGWDGTQWRKLALLWGYSDRLATVAAHDKVGAGDYTMTVVTCAEGYVYVINAINSYNLDGDTTQRHMLYNGSAEMHLKVFTTPGVAVRCVYDNVSYILKKDDEVRVLFASAGDEDRLRAFVWGYRMAIAE